MKKPGSAPAWEEFYERYAGAILSYAMRQGLPLHMAEDVLQEAMMVLLQELPDFTYDPRQGKFRNYLLTIVHRRCISAMRRAGRDGRVFEPTHPKLFEQMVDPAAATADRLIEAAWRQSMEDEAWRRVRASTGHAPRNIAVYEACAREGRTAKEVAREFGIEENHVHQLKNQIGKKVLRELELLLEGIGEAAAS